MIDADGVRWILGPPVYHLERGVIATPEDPFFLGQR